MPAGYRLMAEDNARILRLRAAPSPKIYILFGAHDTLVSGTELAMYPVLVDLSNRLRIEERKWSFSRIAIKAA